MKVKTKITKTITLSLDDVALLHHIAGRAEDIAFCVCGNDNHLHNKIHTFLAQLDHELTNDPPRA